ncbi:YchJ family protein [Aquabacterium sp.]|uniref:YchJ family protein n=1 Tax=Aquabacterium sp. TaxID=1872578 RepID=UPI0027BAC432|nr:YchJ family metal-binding protein [Aquabacterium sp.]
MRHRSAPLPLPDACPCGRPAAYADCCGRYHAGPLALQAPDPESLMRSRYSAFVKDLRSYLLATWHSETRPAEIEAPEPGLQWLGLDVRRAAQSDADHGVVEFVARSKLGGRAHRLHEVSTFVREDGHWLYVRAADGSPHSRG